MRNKLILLFVFLFAKHLYAFPGLGEKPKEESGIDQTQSHIVILQTDAEMIWGSYYFAIQNSTGIEQDFSSSIRLPQESIDFQAADGLANENISILEEGVLRIRKVYPPGLTLQGIQFKVPVKKDSDNILTFVLVRELPMLFFATSQSDLLQFAAEGFEEGIPPMLQGGNYKGIRGERLQAGQQVKLHITGFPGGRLPFFILGACMGTLLLLLAAFLTLRTSKGSDFEAAL